MTAPLVVTLGLDAAATTRFDRLRSAHFPPDRLVVGAHLTLFHALPGDAEPAVADELRAAATRTASLALRCTRVLSLGRGVAFAIDGPGLAELRSGLAAAFAPLGLTAQDSQPHRPHVTVQNKVAPATARALHRELSAGFAPFAVRGEALRLWRYRGGPWEHVLDARLGG